MSRTQKTTAAKQQQQQQQDKKFISSVPSPQATVTPISNAVSAATSVATPKAGPSHEQIAHRAYELFQARGFQNGHDMEDWLQAERELRLSRY